MKLRYKGIYKSENDLPVREHSENAVRYKEPETMEQMGKFLTIASILLVGMCWGFMFVKNEKCLEMNSFEDIVLWLQVLVLCQVCMIPHELLHAICFKEDVELYANLKQMMLFVVGTEDFTKPKFIFMSMLPNVIFGFVPYILFMLQPQWVWLGLIGSLNISAGVGDYMNVINTIMQVPKDAKIYMSGIHSYWYYPE